MKTVDLYHAVPTHKTFFDIVATRGGTKEKDDFLGAGRDLVMDMLLWNIDLLGAVQLQNGSKDMEQKLK